MPSDRPPSLARLALLFAGMVPLAACGAEGPEGESPAAPASAPESPTGDAAGADATTSWPVQAGTALDAPRYPRVVLVSIDTLRRDHVSAYGYPVPTTPFLDSLAEDGVLFENAVASVSHTGPSHATMLTGLHPLEHGVLENGQRLAEEALDLARIFDAAGFATGAFVNVRFLEGVAASFDRLEVRLKEGAPVVDAAIEWLEELDPAEPFFLWVHLYDPHHWRMSERTPRDEMAALANRSPLGLDEYADYISALHGLESDAEGRVLLGSIDDRGVGKELALERGRAFRMIQQYDAQILYADRQVERLFDVIESRAAGAEADEATLWVVTSDHGEGMGSHRHCGHGGRIYQEQLAIPLIIHATDGSLGPRRPAQLVQHVDLFPTLAAAAGVPLRGLDADIEGHSLWPLLDATGAWRDRPAFSQRRAFEDEKHVDEVYALQTPEYKLIRHDPGDDEFFDLRADPLERTSLEGSDERAALERLLDARLEIYRARGQGARDVAVPDEWMEELRALGYVE